MQNKHQAGYYSKNVNNDAFNFMKHVLNERQEDDHLSKADITKKINEITPIEPETTNK